MKEKCHIWSSISLTTGQPIVHPSIHSYIFTSEKRKAKWLNPNCHPTIAQTIKRPAQHISNPDKNTMILA